MRANNEPHRPPSQRVNVLDPILRSLTEVVTSPVADKGSGEGDVLRDATLFLVQRNENYGFSAQQLIEDDIDDPSHPPSKGWNPRYVKWLTRRFIQHLGFRIFTILLILIDLSLVTIDLILDCTPSLTSRIIDYIDVVLSAYFLLELIIRISAFSPRVFFSRKWWFNSVDFVIIAVTAFVSFLDIIISEKLVAEGIFNDPTSETGYRCSIDEEEGGEGSLGSTALRWLRISILFRFFRFLRLLRLIRVYTEHHQIKKAIRQYVSQNKRRYQQDGVDLDLTYITSNIIAMSFPSQGKMAWYRNRIQDVAHFLDKKHGGHYRVYNLCSERTYDDSFFHGNVRHWPIDDHNVPKVREMVNFANEVSEWLRNDGLNVVAVHCKGGKGRTGTMICILLILNKLFHNAATSLDYFGRRRTDVNVSAKFQGVETASQIRYVTYFENLLNLNEHHVTLSNAAVLQYPKFLTVRFHSLSITGLQWVGKGDGSDLKLEISQGGREAPVIFSSRLCEKTGEEEGSDEDFFKVVDFNEAIGKLTLREPSRDVDMSQDVRFKFTCSSSNVPKGYENCAFYFWFHTAFLETVSGKDYDRVLRLKREEIDNPHKERTWKVFRECFSVEVGFNDIK